MEKEKPKPLPPLIDRSFPAFLPHPQLASRLDVERLVRRDSSRPAILPSHAHYTLRVRTDGRTRVRKAARMRECAYVVIESARSLWTPLAFLCMFLESRGGGPP